jgi:hypothetical protein
MKFTLLLFTGLAFSSFSQEDTISTEDSMSIDETSEGDEPWLSGRFKATRIISGHSTQTLAKGNLEFRVEHRFGDLAGSEGGVQQFFGLDNSSDIRLAFEYGVTDKWMIGFGRSKGTNNPYRALLDGLTKYKILDEREGKPLSLAAMGMMTYSYAKASSNVYEVQHYPKQAYRLAYATQIIASKQLGKRLAVSLMPTYVYRNYVLSDDENGIFSLGGAAKLGITRSMGLVAEYYYNFHDPGIRKNAFPALGFGLEWITFGHTFTINVTNSKGFGETQFITGTYENWLKGQFRLGFTITRIFSW